MTEIQASSATGTRLFLILGTAATLTCPAATAEDLFEIDPSVWDLTSLPIQASTPLNVLASSDRAVDAAPEYLSVSESDLYLAEGVEQSSDSLRHKQNVFYTLDTPPCGNSIKSTVAHGRV